ncbi:hypothetical protein C8J56DRAFT_963983 [Mycena floridula]|nr:hypothetical protein C8J56DRAFT_963983 [Mycena floridula]
MSDHSSGSQKSLHRSSSLDHFAFHLRSTNLRHPLDELLFLFRSTKFFIPCHCSTTISLNPASLSFHHDILAIHHDGREFAYRLHYDLLPRCITPYLARYCSTVAGLLLIHELQLSVTRRSSRRSRQQGAEKHIIKEKHIIRGKQRGNSITRPRRFPGTLVRTLTAMS